MPDRVRPQEVQEQAGTTAAGAAAEPTPATAPASAANGTERIAPARDCDTAIAAYTRQLGERVRRLRARRGMSRRLLARDADISERYLGQVEQGRANISVALLWQLAQALGTMPEQLTADAPARARPSPVTELLERLSADDERRAVALLREHFPDHRLRRHGVALVGLRGAGKSTLGARLAQALALPFVKLTDTVEQLGNLAVGELFSLGGQQTYRRLEREAVDHVRRHYGRLVLETGGSVVSEADTYREILGAFFTVWIKTTPQEHMQRVIAQGDLRPMRDNAAAMDDLRAMLRERESRYRAAHCTVNTSGRSIDDCLAELTRAVLEHAPARDPTGAGPHAN